MKRITREKICLIQYQTTIEEIEFVAHCSCGAYTLTINNNDYSVSEDNLSDVFPNIDLDILKSQIENNYYNCNHCVNKWGVDSCACGSGEPFHICNGGFNECGNPMQEVIL